MKILRGGSAEVKPNQWFKFDIELDEQDLLALTVKHNLSQLTVIQKYKLLVKQAELLTTIEMESQGLIGDKRASEILSDFNTLVESLPKVG